MAFIRAKRINYYSGGAFVAPWDLEPGHTQEEWFDAAKALEQVPNIKGRKKAQEDYLKNFRQEYARKNRRN